MKKTLLIAFLAASHLASAVDYDTLAEELIKQGGTTVVPVSRTNSTWWAERHEQKLHEITHLNKASTYVPLNYLT